MRCSIAYRKSTGGGENIRIEVEDERRGQDLVGQARRRAGRKTPRARSRWARRSRSSRMPRSARMIDVETPEIFNKIPAQSAKQIVLQRIREAEQDYLFESYNDRLDDLVMGTVIRRDDRRDGGGYVFDLGKIDGILEEKEQIPGERFKLGQRVRVYVFDLRRAAVAACRRSSRARIATSSSGSSSLRCRRSSTGKSRSRHRARAGQPLEGRRLGAPGDRSIPSARASACAAPASTTSSTS